MKPAGTRPRISVITPCLNGARYIAAALDSVPFAMTAEIEHVVVDGGSNDGTLELLAQRPHLRILRGADRGVYDALNKGLAAAQGDIIGFLNADDRYADGAFVFLDEAFKDPQVAAAGGEAVAFRGAPADDGSVVDHYVSAAADLAFHATLGNPAINAWFFRRSVFADIGDFDPSYRVAGDREFMLRLAVSGLRCAILPGLVYRYRIHPGSMTFSGNPGIWDAVTREHRRMSSQYLRHGQARGRVRSLIRQARTRDTIRVALRAARSGDWRGLLDNAAAGTRFDPYWPLRCIRQALRKA
jgi:glycosyltransferase involved in cell wall biosynthesis